VCVCVFGGVDRLVCLLHQEVKSARVPHVSVHAV